MAYDAGMHGLGWFVPLFIIACKWNACTCGMCLGTLHVLQELQTGVGIRCLQHDWHVLTILTQLVGTLGAPLSWVRGKDEAAWGGASTRVKSL
jgi:hypothetical protein